MFYIESGFVPLFLLNNLSFYFFVYKKKLNLRVKKVKLDILIISKKINRYGRKKIYDM